MQCIRTAFCSVVRWCRVNTDWLARDERQNWLMSCDREAHIEWGEREREQTSPAGMRGRTDDRFPTGCPSFPSQHVHYWYAPLTRWSGYDPSTHPASTCPAVWPAVAHWTCPVRRSRHLRSTIAPVLHDAWERGAAFLPDCLHALCPHFFFWADWFSFSVFRPIYTSVFTK